MQLSCNTDVSEQMTSKSDFLFVTFHIIMKCVYKKSDNEKNTENHKTGKTENDTV